MKRLMLKFKISSYACAAWLFSSLCVPQIAWSATPAGTTILNTAVVSFSVNNTPQPLQTSNTWSVLVDQRIDFGVICATPSVAVGTPSANDALRFTLVNYGNGSEIYGLARANVIAVAPSFTPVNSVQYAPLAVPPSPIAAIFIETNGVAGFQAGLDLPYADATGVLVPAGASKDIYVLSDTPSNVALNAAGVVNLTATSRTPGVAGAKAGTTLLAVNQTLANGVVVPTKAVVVTPGGVAASAPVCAYVASGLGFTLAKTIVARVDPFGGAVDMPGTILTYQLVGTLSGVGTATGLIINDPLNTSTTLPYVTYVPGSITVAGLAKTDAADADNAQFLNNTVSVSLGNVVAPASVVVTFQVKIN